MTGLWLAGAIGICLCLGAAAEAESRLELRYPNEFGFIPAATYDEQGRRVGDASLEIRKQANGNVLINMKSGFENGAQNAMQAELELVTSGDSRSLRILRERSQSIDPSGNPLVILEIDHQNGKATCTPPDGGHKKKKVRVVPLPKQDRVANVPLNLMVDPLIEGQVEKMRFKVFFCLGGPRLLGFVAAADDLGSRAGKTIPGIRKIAYGPDGAGLLSWVAQRMTPDLYIWFDTTADKRYVAHRMPLYSGGPTVYIVREGYDATALIRKQN